MTVRAYRHGLGVVGAALLGMVSATLVAGCGNGAGSGDGDVSANGGAPVGRVLVDASDKACTLSDTELQTGTTTFSIKNSGGQVTEIYVYAAGGRIVTEKENIGPGTSYDLTVRLNPGSYEIACKPGMVGDGIRQAITVTGQTPTAAPVAVAAVREYRSWVQQQVDASVPTVQALVDAVKAGDVEGAKGLYAASRVGWESIEPVAESFGDLDPRMDMREANLETGQKFGGWHRIEKALWMGEDLAPVAPVADQLLADFKEVQSRVADADMSLTSIGNGAKGLLDEVATGKVTGEEEAFSHTDLVDFAANIAGAKKAFDVLRPIVAESAPDLVIRLDQSFANMAAALSAYADGNSYVSYDTVSESQRRALAQIVDALSEPLSLLTAAAVEA